MNRDMLCNPEELAELRTAERVSATTALLYSRLNVAAAARGARRLVPTATRLIVDTESWYYAEEHGGGHVELVAIEEATGQKTDAAAAMRAGQIVRRIEDCLFAALDTLTPSQCGWVPEDRAESTDVWCIELPSADEPATQYWADAMRALASAPASERARPVSPVGCRQHDYGQVLAAIGRELDTWDGPVHHAAVLYAEGLVSGTIRPATYRRDCASLATLLTQMYDQDATIGAEAWEIGIGSVHALAVGDLRDCDRDTPVASPVGLVIPWEGDPADYQMLRTAGFNGDLTAAAAALLHASRGRAQRRSTPAAAAHTVDAGAGGAGHIPTKTQECTERAETLLRRYADETGADACGAETIVVDLLADVMHYCWNRRLSFEGLLDSARKHVNDELPA